MNKWTKVSDKLPEKEVAVICKGKLDGLKTIFAGTYDSDNEWYCFPIHWCGCCRQPETIVTHWMEYPEFPEEYND